MRAWLSSKLASTTVEFLGGSGHGEIYELVFLTYLECLVAARNGNSQRVWELHRKRIHELAGDQPAQPLTRLLPSRQSLVDELKKLERELVGLPVSKQFLNPRQEASGSGEPDIFDLFTSD